MIGLNPKAAFALSVNRNKLFLECNAYQYLPSRVPLHRRQLRDHPLFCDGLSRCPRGHSFRHGNIDMKVLARG
jgi:hypothetical protein